MIDSLSAGLLGALRSTVSDPVNAVPGQVASLDVERFRSAIMGSSPGRAAESAVLLGPAQPGANSFPPPVASGSATSSAGPSIGESILSGLRSVSDDTRERYKHITDVLSNPSPSVSDLMGLQFTLLQNSLQFELTSKLITKAPQTIDSIIKAQ